MVFIYFAILIDGPEQFMMTFDMNELGGVSLTDIQVFDVHPRDAGFVAGYAIRFGVAAAINWFAREMARGGVYTHVYRAWWWKDWNGVGFPEDDPADGPFRQRKLSYPFPSWAPFTGEDRASIIGNDGGYLVRKYLIGEAARATTEINQSKKDD